MDDTMFVKSDWVHNRYWNSSRIPRATRAV